MLFLQLIIYSIIIILVKYSREYKYIWKIKNNTTETKDWIEYEEKTTETIVTVPIIQTTRENFTKNISNNNSVSNKLHHGLNTTVLLSTKVNIQSEKVNIITTTISTEARSQQFNVTTKQKADNITTKSNIDTTLKPLNNTIKQKIVRYKCDNSYLCGGWADRLKGIVSAYAWSLITGRKLEIDIRYPCNMYNVIKPNEVDWYVSDEDIQLENSLNVKVHKMQAIDSSSFNAILTSTDIRQYNNDTDIIIIKNNLDWLRYLSVNPTLQARIKELKYEPKTFRLPYLFKSWYNKLIKFIPKLQNDFEKFKKLAKPNGDKSKLICIQFREYYTRRNESVRIWQFVNNTFLRNMSSNDDYKIFLATDVPSVEVEAMNVFGKARMVKNEGQAEHIDRGATTPNNCTRTDKALVDFHSLQLCDMAVISNSGFGKLGIWNRDNPGENVFIFQRDNTGNYEFTKMNIDDTNIIV